MIAGVAYAEEIGCELRHKKTPFTKFDVLAPEETGWAGQLTKRLLSVPRNFLNTHSVQKSSSVAKPSVQIPVR